jgi:hypothetical protein
VAFAKKPVADDCRGYVAGKYLSIIVIYTPEDLNKPFCTVPPKIDGLKEIFDKGRFYTDVGHEPMPAARSSR